MLRIINLLLLLGSQIGLFAQEQEDLAVEFHYKKYGIWVCEIKNITEYRITMTLSGFEGEGHSDLFFDIVDFKNDTTKRVSFLLKKDMGNPRRVLYLDPGEVYQVSYKQSNRVRFIKALIYIKYSVTSPIHRNVQHYYKTFDLNKIKDRALGLDRAGISINKAVRIYIRADCNTDSLKKAIGLLDEALTLDPTYRMAYLHKAHFLNILGKEKEAEGVIDDALKIFPKAANSISLKVFFKKRGGNRNRQRRVFSNQSLFMMRQSSPTPTILICC